jgi:hypothetical protein
MTDLQVGNMRRQNSTAPSANKPRKLSLKTDLSLNNLALA